MYIYMQSSTGNIIYAEVGPLARPKHAAFTVSCDDDAVEYAKINHNITMMQNFMPLSYVEKSTNKGVTQYTL